MMSVAASRGLRLGWVWSRSTLVRRWARSVIVLSASLVLRFQIAFAARPLRCSVIAPFGQKLESQGTRNRGGLDQFDRHRIAQPVALAGMVPDQRMARLVVAVIVRAERARRNEAVRAGVVELDEQSRARDPADAARESRADAVGEEMRDQPVVGFALGLHGAPFRRRDARRDLAERLDRKS